MEDDIFKLLMIILLLTNDREGDKDNVLTDINKILIIGLMMGTGKNSNTIDDNCRHEKKSNSSRKAESSRRRRLDDQE